MIMAGIASVRAEPPHMSHAVVKHYAEYMNVSDSLIHIPELYATIHEWIGTPYRYGRSDRKGTDCSGFVRNVFLPLCGEQLPRSASGISQIICPKPVSELKEGDLVFFNYYGRTNSHVGIYLQNGWFVHASSAHGVTLNNLHTPYYTLHFSKGGSLKQGELKDLMTHHRMDGAEQLSWNSVEQFPLSLLIPVGIGSVELPKNWLQHKK